VEALEKYGAVMKSPSDYPVQSPYVSIANRQVEMMIRIAAEFGFTPASRSRLPTSSKSDPWLDIPRLEDFDFKQL
jgi:P27 family predicted phage terminase small subunit